jgi:hypothetical protein
MATVTRITLACDMCGSAEDVQTRTIGLDGTAYEIDLCPEDGRRLSQVAAGYLPNARKITARRGRRHHGPQRGSRAGSADRGGRASQSDRQISGQGRAAGIAQDNAQAGRSRRQPARGGGARAKAAGPARGQARASGSQQRKAKTASQSAPAAGPRRDKGIYVYGILPADVQMAAQTPGVGEPPGLLRVVRRGGLAALISEVDASGRLGSPDDLRAHGEILDATAAAVPVVPLRFGEVLASEDAVAEELLAAHHDRFAAALDELEGRAEFVIQGRYLKDTVAAGREQDTRTLAQAMDGHCVASVVRQPADELDAIHVAFLVEAGQQNDIERVVENLARDWEGRIEVQLLGPMAAYDFTAAPTPKA